MLPVSTPMTVSGRRGVVAADLAGQPLDAVANLFFAEQLLHAAVRFCQGLPRRIFTRPIRKTQRAAEQAL